MSVSQTSIDNYFNILTNLKKDEQFVLEWFRQQNEKFTADQAAEKIIKLHPEKDFKDVTVKSRISELNKKRCLTPDGKYSYTKVVSGKKRTITAAYYRFNRYMIEEEPLLF